MVPLIKREFTVGAPLQTAWEHLARVEQWPSWAPHIKRLELSPPGELGPQSTGVIRLANGLSPTFRVTEFNPPRSWKWAGPFLWCLVHYDHQFEALDAGHTKLTFVVEAEGFAAGILGPLFARVYRGSLDKAIPLLIREMAANPASP